MSAVKQLRRAATVRKRKEARLASRTRSRENATAAAVRREEMRNAPPSAHPVRTGLLPASIAMAAMALVGGAW